MSGGARTFLIDAGFASGTSGPSTGAGDALVLIPDGGEYARAVAGLAARPPRARSRVPDEVFFHLYAYELLERMRQIAAAGLVPGAGSLVIPFWPAAVFDAAGAIKSGVLEIQGMYPPAPMKYYVARPLAVVEEEASRVFGAALFDAAAYLERMEAIAVGPGWTLREGA